MPTAIQNREIVKEALSGLGQTNLGWINDVLDEWERSLDAAELEKRVRQSETPKEEAPIADAEIDDLLDRILTPSRFINPRWAETPQKEGLLFQRQFEIILKFNGYFAYSENPVGPDGGIDIEAITQDGKTIIIQVKKYQNAVNKLEVEGFHKTILHSSYGVVLPELWFVAPKLTDGAREYCRENGIHPIEVAQLKEFLGKAMRNGVDPQDLLTADPSVRLDPEWGSL